MIIITPNVIAHTSRYLTVEINSLKIIYNIFIGRRVCTMVHRNFWLNDFVPYENVVLDKNIWYVDMPVT